MAIEGEMTGQHELSQRPPTRRVFLSHTSELREFPRDGSFVAAAEAAIVRAGCALTNMAYFTARDSRPAAYCVSKVAEADIYVGIIGFRYGSPVRDRPNRSYTELEFQTAVERQLPCLILMLDENASVPIPVTHLFDKEYADRQQAFRRLLQQSSVTTASVASPADLELKLYQALIELVPQAIRQTTSAPSVSPNSSDTEPPLGQRSAPAAAVRWLTARARLVRSAAASSPRRTMIIAFLATALVVTVVIASSIGTRITGTRANPPIFSALPGLDCRLPVVITDRGFPPSTVAAGFVSLDSGVFQRDRTVTADGLPFSKQNASNTWQAVTYDRVVKRWLPVRPPAVSPDQSSYAYIVATPPNSDVTPTQGSELHVYDVVKRVDRTLWSGSFGIDFPIQWMSDGIHFTTTPLDGGRGQGWMIPPSGGSPFPAAGLPATVEYARTNIGTIFPHMRYEAEYKGIPIYRDVPDASHYTINVSGSVTQHMVIHSGTVGDSTNFDPSTFVEDGDFLWSANADGTAIWLWSPTQGLHRFPLKGAVKGQSTTTYWAAGGCV
jgi:hypothetical protein